MKPNYARCLICLGLLLAASTCFAQMYTVADLGTLGGGYSEPHAMNHSGQVVGISLTSSNAGHAFRTEPNKPINPATDDLGAPSGIWSEAFGINNLGQVVLQSCRTSNGLNYCHGFRTAPDAAVNPATDDLGTLGGNSTEPRAINRHGQVVGASFTNDYEYRAHAFRTGSNRSIDPATDTLEPSGAVSSGADDINDSGQVVGCYQMPGDAYCRGFRTAPNKPINPATDQLGTLWMGSVATAINGIGQAAGYSAVSYSMTGGNTVHAFRTAPNQSIHAATDDLGTLGGRNSAAMDIDDFGQVVGFSDSATAQHPFIYSGRSMRDLNDLIPTDSGWVLNTAVAINSAGEIAGFGSHDGRLVSYRLNPIYRASVRPPLAANGSTVFSYRRGVVPVKFGLTQYNMATCVLPQATIALTRIAGGLLGPVYNFDSARQRGRDSEFRIDPTACQYIFNLKTSSLGAGKYRIDISISGVMVGHALFALK